MIAAQALLVADALTAVTAAYWACLIIGGGLLAISVLGGLAHGAPDVDIHADAGAGDMDAGAAGAGHAGGATEISAWFSMRFVVFFLAGFGAFGVILTYVAGASPGTTFGVALVGGLIVGQAAHRVFRLIRRTSGDSTPQPGDYVNRLGRVTIAIKAPSTGEVAIQVRGAERFVPAVAAGETRQFAVGAEAVVIGYRTGVAEVVSKEEFERMRRSA